MTFAKNDQEINVSFIKERRFRTIDRQNSPCETVDHHRNVEQRKQYYVGEAILEDNIQEKL
jgi:hypothetical protein